MNMSYCRFQNTVIDVRDCLNTLRYRGDETPLSTDEFEACREMFEAFLDFCYDEEILEEGYSAMQERLEEFLQNIETENE